MKKTLLGMLAVTSICFSDSFSIPDKSRTIIDNILAIVNAKPHYPHSQIQSLATIKRMLESTPAKLNPAVINKVLATLQCTHEYNVDYNNVLTIIDYSLPSSEKRLWVFDLKSKKLLFYTYVSHGIRSGALMTNYFSNKYNSKASSIGVYTTNKAYYGREGLSLRLDGLDRGFNDNASNRAVVMHGGWYANETFIKKYGRPGRSWGCPALPSSLSDSIINTIKDKSLFVIYYPSDGWFAKSKFLNCKSLASNTSFPSTPEASTPVDEDALRGEILFADKNKNNQREESEPVVVISANNYQQIFHTSAPVERMLRRQIENEEYVAINVKELGELASDVNQQSVLHFVVPEIVMKHGYYETLMKLVDPGKVIRIQRRDGSDTFTIEFDKNLTYQVIPTKHFIRWLGL